VGARWAPQQQGVELWEAGVVHGGVVRKREDIAVLGAGFGNGRTTAYRYHDEAVTVLAEQAPDLHEALHVPNRGYGTSPPWCCARIDS
jgi:hypothetical protein